jgi:hypothetical protein
MRVITADIEIDASPAEVWTVLTDLSSYPDWNPHIREAAGQVAAGNRLTMRMYPATGRPVTIRPIVLAARPGTQLLLRGALPGIFGRLVFSGEHSFTLTDSGGGTYLVQSESFRGALIPFIGKSLTAAQASFSEHNQALKRRAEALVAGLTG